MSFLNCLVSPLPDLDLFTSLLDFAAFDANSPAGIINVPGARKRDNRGAILICC